jgi:hypothetical protein
MDFCYHMYLLQQAEIFPGDEKSPPPDDIRFRFLGVAMKTSERSAGFDR